MFFTGKKCRTIGSLIALVLSGVISTAGATPIGPSCLTNVSAPSTDSGFASVRGAVSATAIVVVSGNSRIQTYRRVNCALTGSQNLADFFASTGINATTFVINPQVIYDPQSARFFVAGTGVDVINQDKYFLYAVSTDGKATAWSKYKQDIAVGGGSFCSAGTSWGSGRLGVQSNRWLATGTESLLIIDKTPTLTGQTPAVRCLSPIGAALVPPVVYDANTRATLLGTASGGSTLSRYDLEVFPANIAVDSLVQRADYRVPAFTSPATVSQPGGQKLNIASGFGVSIQIGSNLWNVHTVNVTVGTKQFARWRLYKLGNGATGSSPVVSTFTAPSTVAGNNDHLFNASLATGSSAAGTPVFVTATRVIPSLTAGYQGNAALLVFEGPSNSTLTTDWLFSIAALSKFRYSLDGEGNTCNTSPLFQGGGCALFGGATQVEIDPRGGINPRRAWSFGLTTGSRNQLSWRTRAVRSEYGPF